MNTTTPGQVLTFYSYKGGTGRTMALANTACLLAQQLSDNKRILMIDWDLEAPGLHRFFRENLNQYTKGKKDQETAIDERPGLLDLFIEITNNIPKDQPQTEEDARKLFQSIKFEEYLLTTDISGLDLLKAGKFDDHYSTRVNAFTWDALYHRSPGLFKAFADYVTERYQYVLVDSRTGLTDISGICTMLLPEKLVVVFTPNRQSLTGIVKMVQDAVQYRRESDDPRPLVVFPLPSRIESTRPALQKEWREGNRKHEIPGYQPEFERLLRQVYRLKACDLETYFDEVQLQHIPDYAYGEQIAVRKEESHDRLSLSRSYENFTERLIHLHGPWETLSGPMIEKRPQELQTQHIKNQNNTGRRSLNSNELYQKIIDFLLSLPNIHDSSSRKALIYSAGLDTTLRELIYIDGTPEHFVNLLIGTLRKYGKLDDGRDPLEVLLDVSKSYIGQEKQAYCNMLIQELQERTKMKEQQTSMRFSLKAILSLLGLIGIILGTNYLTTKTLAVLFESYSQDAVRLTMYGIFVLVSLIISIIVFGILKSIRIFKMTQMASRYEFGGAMAGFLITLMLFFASMPSQPLLLEIRGNVRFVNQDGNTIGLAEGIEVSIAGQPGSQAKTDTGGNFLLQLAENQKAETVELIVKYEGQTIYQRVKVSEVNSIAISKIEAIPQGRYGILIAIFKENTKNTQFSGKDIQGSIVSALSGRFAELKITNVITQAIPISFETHDAAREFGKKLNAELVVWGDLTLTGIIPRLTLINPDSQVAKLFSPDETLLNSDLSYAKFAEMTDIRLPALTDEPIALVTFVMALKFAEEEEYEKALSYFDQSLKESSSQYMESAILYLFRGDIYLRLKQYENAISDYTKAIELEPEYEVAYVNRGYAYQIQEQYEQALKDYQKAIALQPNFAEAYYRQGILYYEQDEYDNAIKAFQQALQLNPKHIVAYYDLGNVYFDQNDYDSAIAIYSHAIELNPDFAGAYNNRGLVYQQQGAYNKAIADFEKAIKVAPPIDEAYDSYAWLLAACPDSSIRDGNKAISLAEKALEMTPNEPRFLETLAAAYAEIGNFDRAIETQQKAITLWAEYVPSETAERLKAYQNHQAWRNVNITY